MHLRETRGGIWRTAVPTRAQGHTYILFIPRHTHYDTLLEVYWIVRADNVAYLGLYSDPISFLRCVFV